jgi:hypothetical protein
LPEVWGEEEVKTLFELLYKVWPMPAEEGAYMGWRTGNDKGVLEIDFIHLWE